MDVSQQIADYIAGQPEPKRNDMQALHQLALRVLPDGQLWFLNGKNSDNQTVANPNIGYGLHTIRYANGTTKAFYQIGMSANTSGISVYIMGINDKNFLAHTYGATIGKAKLSGYCIKFKTLKDINVEVLEAAMRCGLEQAAH